MACLGHAASVQRPPPPDAGPAHRAGQGVRCARVVFNDGLHARQEARAADLPYIKDTDLQKQVITAAKHTPERAWLAEVSSVVLVQALADLHTAYRNFFAALSDGRKVAAPKFLRRAERKLRKAQQALSRKAKGSSNRKKAVVRVAKAHAKTADARRDHHHKLSTTIIRDNQAVFVEDLAVKGLARTRMAKSVHDAGWSQFVNMIEYKAARYGRVFVKVDRFFPSSQMCSGCGTKDGPKPLAVRGWTCGGCGTHHDRDVNAARNIRTEGTRVAAGRAETINACGG